MSTENESNMEIEESNKTDLANDDTDCELVDDSPTNGHKSMPSTPNCDKKSNLNLKNTNFNSAEKLDKNLKLQIKLENTRKKQEEKERKDREKKEREEQRLKREEEARKKKEEEERLRLKKQEEREKEKERKAAELAEKERIRLELLNQRNEEKKKREEEKRQKEEEKRKLEEEKQKEDEEKRRKEEKIKTQFISFFIKKEVPVNEKNEDHKNLRFMPFQPKENMKVAPINRREDLSKMNTEEREEFYQNFIKTIFSQDQEQSNFNYLNEIRKNPNLIRKCKTRCRRNSDNSEIKEIVINDTNQTKFKVKYLHFDPKVYKRPPYYGTWRKKSNFIKPRKPFGKDQKILDYEIDSDDEWEDEPEGESILDSDKGEEDEEVVDEDDDDGFFVPHGHLSDDELDEDERTLDPETKKARETAKKDQWESERKKSSKVLLPKCFIISNYWNAESTYDKDSKIVEQIKLFERLKIVPLVNTFPININNEISNQQKIAEDASNKLKTSKNSNLVTNEASPSTSKTSKTTKSAKIVLNPQSPMSNNTNISAATTTSTASPNNSTTILKFISKMSKKDVICKLEPVNNNSTNSTNNSNPAPSSPLPSKVTSNFATPGTPNSPKMTPTNTTAEKRVCSGNGENAVKRLKLDDGQTINNNEQKLTTTPNSIVNMFKNASSCKKSLKMSNSVSASNEVEYVDISKSGSDTSIKMDITPASESDSDKPANELNNKENKINFITLD